MVSQGEETTFTLSFGGVEFCLAPSCNDDANSATDNAMAMSVSNIGKGEVSIHLNNFSGTLRVKNLKEIADAPSGGGEIAPQATRSLPESEKNEDVASIVDVDALSQQNEPADAAAPALVAVPNPVEDTPSPPAKSCVKDEPSTEKSKNQKGQQKLNFFGKHGKKHKKGKNQGSSVISKRNPEEEDSEPNTRKKLRRSNRSEQKESNAAAHVNELFEDPKVESVDMTESFESNEPELNEPPAKTDFEDIIEEPKNETNVVDKSFALSLGQSMPSQEIDFLGNGCDLSPETINEEASCLGIPASNRKKRIATPLGKSSMSETSAPCPRWGQTMTMIDHKRFIVYGGQTIDKDEAKPLADLFVYDLMEHAWTKPVNCDGIARTWHTANFLPDRQLLLCFGGEVLSEKTGRLTTTDQVMVFDCEIMLWYPPSVTGQVPSGRSGHASCILPQTSTLVVFGGVKNGKWLNSASILDTHLWKWTTLKAVGDAPPPRSYHSATAISSDYEDVGNRVVIFGGNDGSKCFNGVHVLEAAGGGKKWVWSNPKCKGDAPSPRTGHAATLLNDGSTILVYGGWDPNTEDENGDDLIFGDSFLLDTKTWAWRKGPKPRYEKSTKKNAANAGAGRVGHSAVLAGFHSVLAFGGRVPENKFADDFQSLAVPI